MTIGLATDRGSVGEPWWSSVRTAAPSTKIPAAICNGSCAVSVASALSQGSPTVGRLVAKLAAQREARSSVRYSVHSSWLQGSAGFLERPLAGSLGPAKRADDKKVGVGRVCRDADPRVPRHDGPLSACRWGDGR